MATFPTATRKSAFLAGFSLVVFIALLELLGRLLSLPEGSSEKQLFPLAIIYFFVSALIFVIGVRSIFPSELKTRIPFVYFPTDRAGLNFMLRVWGRMLIWFLGAACAGALGALWQWVK